MTAGQAKRAPEVKSALDEGDVTGAFHEFMNAFETFKEANNEKLKQLETRSADVVTVDKVERISQALDEQKQALDTLVLKKTRPMLGRGGAPLQDLERKQAFDAYMRSGDERGMRSLEEKAMSYARRRMVAIWCRMKRRQPSARGWRNSRRSAPSPRCGRFRVRF